MSRRRHLSLTQQSSVPVPKIVKRRKAASVDETGLPLPDEIGLALRKEPFVEISPLSEEKLASASASTTVCSISFKL